MYTLQCRGCGQDDITDEREYRGRASDSSRDWYAPGRYAAILGADIHLEEALAEKYEAIIVDAHLTDCLWKRRGCDGWLDSCGGDWC